MSIQAWPVCLFALAQRRVGQRVTFFSYSSAATRWPNSINTTATKHAMNRRDFLGASLSIGALRAIPASSSCGLPVGMPAAPGGWVDQAHAIIKDAARAPSSHNSQPWQIGLHDREHWRLSRAPGRDLPVVDPDGRECSQSLGAFLVGLEVAAAARGLRLEHDECAGAAGALPLRFSPRSTDTTWLPALRQRRTLRKALAPLAGCEAALAACLAAAPSARFFAHGTPAAWAIADATLEATAAQCKEDAVWHELARWIRWREGEIAENPTGVTPATMELPWLAQRWVAATYSRDDVLTPAFRARSLELAARQVQEGAGWLVFTTEHDTPADWRHSGAELMRLWLRAVPAAIALHPMSQALEVLPQRRSIEAALGLKHIQLLVRVGTRPYPPDTPSPRLAAQRISALL